MNLTQLFQKKNLDNQPSADRSRSSEMAKKVVQKPPKAKKVEVTKKPSRKPEEPKLIWMHRFRQYLREVVYELRKVVWPSRKETVGSTSVVLVIVILCGIFLGVVDLILSRLMRLLVG